MAVKPISSIHALLMITLITFWGSSFVVVKIALREGLTPISIATFRFLVAGGMFLVALLLMKIRKQSYRLLVDRKDVLNMLFLSLTGVTFFFSAQYVGIQMAGASIAAIFVCLLSPILIAVLSAQLLKEKLTKRQILGIGLAAVGSLTVILGGTSSIISNGSFLSGSLILLLTPILWASYNLFSSRVMGRYNPFLIVAYVSLLGGLCLIPISLAERSLHLVYNLSLQGWVAILYLAGTCSVFGYFIWFYVMERVGATVTSSFLFAEPLITVLLATAFVGEAITWSITLGGLLIFVGVYLVTMKLQAQNR